MDRMLTLNEVADHLQVGPKTINTWVRLGKIPYTRIGGRIVRFSERQLNEWLKRQENQPWKSLSPQ